MPFADVGLNAFSIGAQLSSWTSTADVFGWGRGILDAHHIFDDVLIVAWGR